MNETFAEKLAQSINDMQMKKLANASSFESINNSSMYMLFNNNNPAVGGQTANHPNQLTERLKDQPLNQQQGSMSQPVVGGCSDDNAVNIYDDLIQQDNSQQSSGGTNNLIGKYVSNFQMHIGSDSNCSMGLNNGLMTADQAVNSRQQLAGGFSNDFDHNNASNSLFPPVYEQTDVSLT
jgi:hypothetical protein